MVDSSGQGNRTEPAQFQLSTQHPARLSAPSSQGPTCTAASSPSSSAMRASLAAPASRPSSMADCSSRMRWKASCGGRVWVRAAGRVRSGCTRLPIPHTTRVLPPPASCCCVHPALPSTRLGHLLGGLALGRALPPRGLHGAARARQLSLKPRQARLRRHASFVRGRAVDTQRFHLGLQALRLVEGLWEGRAGGWRAAQHGVSACSTQCGPQRHPAAPTPSSPHLGSCLLGDNLQAHGYRGQVAGDALLGASRRLQVS